MNLRILLAGSLFALLAACSVPINLSFDVLGETSFSSSGSFVVGEGGLDGVERVGPILVELDVDDRVTINSATLSYNVCFTPQEEGISGSLSYELYIAPAAVGDEEVFTGAHLVSPAGEVDLGDFTPETPLCVDGSVQLSAAQVAALNSGTFKLGADITGEAEAAADIVVDYEVIELEINLSGSGGL